MRTTRARIAALFFLTAAAALGSSLAQAKEDATRFVNALHKQHYGEVGISYIEQLKQEGTMPAELGEAMDLELAKFFNDARSEAYNVEEGKSYLAKSQEHLLKFLKDHPGHARRAEALATAGDLKSYDALEELHQARMAKEKEEKTAHFLAARKLLEEVRPSLAEAAEYMEGEYHKAKAAMESRARGSAASKNQKEKLAQLQLDWLDEAFKVAMVDYYVAQTYPVPDEKAPKDNPADKPRKDAYDRAFKALDLLYQDNRDRIVGIYAKLWQGKVKDELGDYATAQDIYDEVLSLGPDSPTDQATGLEPVVSLAMQFRLGVTHKLKGRQQFIAEAEQWLRPFNDAGKNGKVNEMIKEWRKAPGFQGLLLDLAVADLDEAVVAKSNEERAKLRRKAVDILKQMVKVPSDHSAEAMVLLKQNEKFGGAAEKVEPKTFAEAVGLGDASLQSGDFKEAVEYFEKALTLGDKLPPKEKQKLLAEAQKNLDTARLRYGYKLVQQDKTMAQAYEIADRLAHERERSEVGGQAAALAAEAAFGLYANTRKQGSDEAEKKAAFERFTKAADYAVKHWPSAPDTDTVRMRVGQIALADGDFKHAIESFDLVNERSSSRGDALHWTGYAHWQLYRREKRKADDQRDEALEKQEKEAAETALRGSVAKMQATVDKAVDPLPDKLFETQLLLGELLLDVGKPEDAAQMAAPLFAKVKAQPPKDQITLMRTCILTMRAYMASKQAEKAAEVVKILTDAGEDRPEANQPLCQFARMVDGVVKEARAEVIELGNANKPKELAAATTRLEDNQKLLADLLQKLAVRKNNSLSDMVLIGDACGRVKLFDVAEDQYKRVLEEKKNEPNFSKAEMRVRSQLAGLLRQKAAALVDAGKSDEAVANFKNALDQIDAMIAGQPKALEPRMERGRILQDWSKIDPQKFEDAKAHWSKLKSQLAGAKGKKPPEYYEVVYLTADCCYTQAQKIGAKQPAEGEKSLVQGEQLLKAALILAPNLNGPDMVARYKELLKKIQLARKNAPAAGPEKTTAGALLLPVPEVPKSLTPETAKGMKWAWAGALVVVAAALLAGLWMARSRILPGRA